jgi:hypothetical protein
MTEIRDQMTPVRSSGPTGQADDRRYKVQIDQELNKLKVESERDKKFEKLKGLNPLRLFYYWLTLIY